MNPSIIKPATFHIRLSFSSFISPLFIQLGSLKIKIIKQTITAPIPTNITQNFYDSPYSSGFSDSPRFFEWSLAPLPLCGGARVV
jgi:uncharacterized membrane protein YhdT